MSTNVRPLAIETLLRRGWPSAAALVRSRVRDLDGLTTEDLDSEMWSDDRERSKLASRLLVERLTELGYADEALAARLLTVDPQQPDSFGPVMQSLTAALKTAGPSLRAEAAPLVRFWWRAASGVYRNDPRSIFAISFEETTGVRRRPQPDLTPLFARGRPEPRVDPEPQPGVVVMPKATSSKLGSNQLEYKDLVDARLPLVVARDIAGVRRTLLAEYPHAVNAIHLLLRDLAKASRCGSSRSCSAVPRERENLGWFAG
jgi:ATP-dependent Lon protease